MIETSPQPYRLELMPPCDFEFLYDLCRSTMERYVIAAWGEWCDEIVRSQLFDGLKANAFNSIFVDRSRVGAIALLSIAQQSDLTPAQVATKAESAGFDLNANPKLKQLLEQIITNRSKVNG